MYYSIVVVALLCMVAVAHAGQPPAPAAAPEVVKKTPVIVDKGNFGPNGQRLGLMSAPMRHRYGYDAMHIHGKPFVTCNHPAFKFGCAHMTFPRKFMNQHHKLIMGAQIEHKNEFRKPVRHLGLAPTDSMFVGGWVGGIAGNDWWGPRSRSRREPTGGSKRVDRDK